MLDRIIIDIKNGSVFDDSGHDLGRTGDVKTEIDHDKAMIYMTVNLIIPAANFRKIADAMSNREAVKPARSIKL